MQDRRRFAAIPAKHDLPDSHFSHLKKRQKVHEYSSRFDDGLVLELEDDFETAVASAELDRIEFEATQSAQPKGLVINKLVFSSEEDTFAKNGELHILRENLRLSSEELARSKMEIANLKVAHDNERQERERFLTKELEKLKTVLDFKEQELQEARCSLVASKAASSNHLGRSNVVISAPETPLAAMKSDTSTQTDSLDRPVWLLDCTRLVRQPKANLSSRTGVPERPHLRHRCNEEDMFLPYFKSLSFRYYLSMCSPNTKNDVSAFDGLVRDTLLHALHLADVEALVNDMTSDDQPVDQADNKEPISERINNITERSPLCRIWGGILPLLKNQAVVEEFLMLAQRLGASSPLAATRVLDLMARTGCLVPLLKQVQPPAHPVRVLLMLLCSTTGSMVTFSSLCSKNGVCLIRLLNMHLLNHSLSASVLSLNKLMVGFLMSFLSCEQVVSQETNTLFGEGSHLWTCVVEYITGLIKHLYTAASMISRRTLQEEEDASVFRCGVELLKVSFPLLHLLSMKRPQVLVDAVSDVEFAYLYVLNESIGILSEHGSSYNEIAQLEFMLDQFQA